MRGILLDNAFSVTLDTVGPLTDFARVMYGGGGADGSERGGAEDATDGVSDGSADCSEGRGVEDAADGKGADGVSDGGPDDSSGTASELAPAAC